MLTSHKIDNSLHIVTLTLPSLENTPKANLPPPRQHRIFTCDVSGSMSSDLPAHRQHLKNNIALTVSPDDDVSIIWFSGRGQFGVVVEAFKVKDASSLAFLNTAIDRYLRPVGLTGFKEPLQEVLNVITRLKRNDPDGLFSLIFLSDGYDNQWPERDILDLSRKIGEVVSASAIVEYGWYANRKLLSQMAEEMGGEYIFSENFTQFSPVLDREFSRSLNGQGGKKRDVQLPVKPLHGVVFAVAGTGSNSSVYTFASDEHNVVRIPESITEIGFLSSTKVGNTGHDCAYLSENHVENADSLVLTYLYAGIAVLAPKMLGDDTIRVLKALGDVELILQFSNCFGKQSYSTFRDLVIECAGNPARRFSQGWNGNLIPADDAYTVIDLLSDLMEKEDNLLYIGHPDFVYNPVSRKMVQVNGNDEKVPEDVLAEVQELLKNAKTVTEIATATARLNEIVANNKAEPKLTFKSDARENNVGVPLNKMVFNESRPNISMLTVQSGVVMVGENPVKLPNTIPSHIFRNYTVICDGILNMEKLPVSLSRDTFNKLKENAVIGDVDYNKDQIYTIDLSRVPIINRKMVKRVSGRDFFSLEWQLLKSKSAQKVYGYYRDQYAPKEKSANLKLTYGEEATEWLKERGVTDAGFAPKVAQAEASDVYMGKEMKVSFKGYSSLPKVSDVSDKLARGGKMNASETLMSGFVKEVEDFLKIANGDQEFIKTWINSKIELAIKTTRHINRKLAEVKFAIMVGQVWFPDWDSLDDCTMTFDADPGVTVVASVSLKEIEVKI